MDRWTDRQAADRQVDGRSARPHLFKDVWMDKLCAFRSSNLFKNVWMDERTTISSTPLQGCVDGCMGYT
eukprot:209380-Chlamydomonas_euryale.AAC.2